MPLRALLLLALTFVGCASSSRDRAWVARSLQERTGASLRDKGQAELPSEVSLDDGLDEAEVIAVALWRSPAIRMALTQVDAAQATLREARRPANPQLTVMGPFGPVSAVATLLVPLESLVQMPYRSETAARDADVAGELAVMTALDVVRDVRLQHIELALATERATIQRELAEVSAHIARIAQVRASTGDISPMQERVLTTDAQRSLDASDTADTQRSIAEEKLLALLALERLAAARLRATFLGDVPSAPPLDTLLKLARQARPDVRAASFAIEAAAARTHWEQSRVLAFAAQAETHWAQAAGPAMRLGGRVELPLFGANPGGVGRAEADAERALAQHETVTRTTVVEVTTARARLEQATRSHERFEFEVLPALNDALAIATHSFEAGDESYWVVLDVLTRTAEARLRQVELVAEQRRARCDLERAIGARLVARPVAHPTERPQGGDR